MKIKNKTLSITLGLIIILSFCFIYSQSSIEPNNDVINFANNIVKEYRLKNNYSGLQKTFNGLIAGNEKGEQVALGSKNFFIIAKKNSKEKCISLLQPNTQELNLISININGKILVWGDGLPIEKKQLKELCKTENTIIWNFL